MHLMSIADSYTLDVITLRLRDLHGFCLRLIFKSKDTLFKVRLSQRELSQGGAVLNLSYGIMLRRRFRTAACRVGSLWILMDKETRRTFTSKESGIELSIVKNAIIPIRISTVSRKIDGAKCTGTDKPLHIVIDFNGRVNNIRYADWLCNAMGLKAAVAGQNHASFFVAQADQLEEKIAACLVESFVTHFINYQDIRPLVRLPALGKPFFAVRF